MLKKAGMLTVGVTAGLLAVAPLANAGVSSHDVKGDSDKGHSRHHDDNDHGKHHSKKHHKHDNGGDNRRCEFNGGDAEGSSDSRSESVIGAAGASSLVSAAAGSNLGNIGNCSDILSHNLDDNQVNLVTFGSGNER